MQTGVLIYEDNQSLRESLANLILYTKDLVLLGNFGDLSGVENQVREFSPEVILMDIDLPGTNGINGVKKIRSFNQDTQILMLTVFDDNRHVYDAICAGASGYLLKKHISDKLLDAIREVMHGEAPMSPGIARMVIQNLQQSPKPVENKYNLTPREKEILGSLSQGKSYKITASDLGISIDTVRTHIKHIYEKLQVHSQTEAVAKSNRENIV